MNIDEMKCNISHLLEDRGLTREYKEPSVRLLLYHLYVAMDIYRYMTLSEKNKAGFWYRTFRNSYRLTGFLKERKRKREKKNSPLHPSYKERETEVKEKEEKTLSLAELENSALDEDQIAFWNECKQFIGKEYSYKMVQSFFFHWGEKAKKNHKMLWQSERSWNTAFRLAAWKNKSYSVNDEVAAIRLQKAKKKQAEEMNAAEQQQTVAAIREQADARREQEQEQSKENQMLTDEYLAKNPDGILAKMARERKAKEERKTKYNQ